MSTYCYCESAEKEQCMLQCTVCKNYFHPGCLKHGRPSSLEGDVFFYLTCADCGPDETCQRMKLQWLHVVALALYNLQLQGTGKCGFFRWKEHICAFITKYWTVFFGHDRRKTQTWFGTVAGTLSAGCPQFFRSGTHILKENGWWALAQNKAPSLDMLTIVKNARRQSSETEARHQPQSTVVEGLRKRDAKTTLQSAIELRAKRDTIQINSKQSAADKSQHEQEMTAALPLPAVTSSLTSPLASSQTSSLTSSLTSSQTSSQTSPLTSSLTSSQTSSQSTSMFSSSVVMPTDFGSPHDAVTSTFGGSLSRVFPSAVSHEAEASQMSWLSSSEHSCSSHSTHGLLSQTEDLVVNESLPEFLMKGDEEDASDLEIDPCAMSPALDTVAMETSEDSGLPSMSSLLDSIQAPDKREDTQAANKLPTSPELTEKSTSSVVHIKTEPADLPPEFATSNLNASATVLPGPASAQQASYHNNSSNDSETENSTAANSRKRKMTDAVKEEPLELPAKPRMVPMSLHEEKQLLKTLGSLHSVVDTDSTARRLRAKLRLREIKKQHGLPLFEMESFLSGNTRPRHRTLGNQQDYQMLGPRQYNILDRYQMSSSYLGQSQTSVSFMNRLVGTEDDQLQPVCSPYTSRMLKAFIRRDYECRPLKMKLLMEIQAYPHNFRKDTTWKPEPTPPVDYCYVRPQHIPSVNALCQQFFWPSIDVSECLQYPDFSCVVLYRKFVIGFAFMVPDVKYNEAYISFLFTHPEWRGAGIATFMIYHLLQTCMGKDVTLHVSANNPAMMLYQKFGFKIQQLVLDFYEKYFPEESTQSRHAYLLRLNR